MNWKVKALLSFALSRSIEISEIEAIELAEKFEEMDEINKKERKLDKDALKSMIAECKRFESYIPSIKVNSFIESKMNKRKPKWKR